MSTGGRLKAVHNRTDASLTVGITTRNRPQAVVRCLKSLETFGDRLARVIVVDDTSDTPVADSVGAIPAGVRAKLDFIVHRKAEGNIVGRNEIMKQAPTEYVLLLDDDAF